jgi:hypothetical protein
MTATIEEVAAALRQLGLRAEIIDDTDDDREQVLGINVWVGDQQRRHADDTIWPPLGTAGWVWGDKFQWGIDANADVDAVVHRVMETVRARP